jgi:serine/threonine-protein kinase RsbW
MPPPVTQTTSARRPAHDTPEQVCTHAAFRLPASIENRHLALNLLSTLIDHVVAEDLQFRYEMLTAFGEAFNNIVIHGYSGRSDGVVDVETDLSPEQVTVRLIDTGTKVDFSRVVPPDLESMPENGMGVFIMYALVDKVEYHGGAVNVLSLTKRTSSEPATPR